jgi:hypothetical protein
VAKGAAGYTEAAHAEHQASIEARSSIAAVIRSFRAS